MARLAAATMLALVSPYLAGPSAGVPDSAYVSRPMNSIGAGACRASGLSHANAQAGVDQMLLGHHQRAGLARGGGQALLVLEPSRAQRTSSNASAALPSASHATAARMLSATINPWATSVDVAARQQFVRLADFDLRAGSKSPAPWDGRCG